MGPLGAFVAVVMRCEAPVRRDTEQRQDFHWQSGNGGSVDYCT